MSEQDTPQSSGDERSQNARQPEHGRRDRSGGGGRRRHQQKSPRRPEASLNMDELRELVALIASGGFTDFELEREDFRVRLRRDLAAPPQPLAEEAAAPTQSHTSAPSTQGAVPARQQENAEPSVPLAVKPHPGAQAEAEASADEGLHIITSPIVGTFYRAPSPTSEAFIRLGSRVDPDTVVCIIEAMKLMNEIQAETSGEVAKIYVENGQPVEYGQPLFGIKK